MNAFVVDASVVLKWFVNEPNSERAVALRQENKTRIAPDYLLLECANVVWKMVRQKRLTSQTGEGVIDSLNRLPVTLHSTDRFLKRAYKLAVELNSSVYDCFYLSVGLTYDCPLVTADKRLYNAVKKSAFQDYVQLL
ncbi:MAG: type II toxin-antitoxin system VapC family toxin [Candidatus Obscuribacterales bacterium]|nr:type II toxin-antitoxin system VapC family toxin [Candidatus Obscuribacterales bacterium]